MCVTSEIEVKEVPKVDEKKKGLFSKFMEKGAPQYVLFYHFIIYYPLLYPSISLLMFLKKEVAKRKEECAIYIATPKCPDSRHLSSGGSL